MANTCDLTNLSKSNIDTVSAAPTVADTAIFLLNDNLKYDNYLKTFKNNMVLHNYMLKNIKLYIARLAFGDRRVLSNKMTYNSKDFKNNIARFKLELVSNFLGSLDYVVLDDGTKFKIKDYSTGSYLFTPLGANVDAYLALKKNIDEFFSNNLQTQEDINTFNPYENEKVAKKFVSIYLLNNFDAILKDVLLDEITINDPGLVTTTDYILNKFEAKDDKFDDTQFDLSAHVSRRMKLLFTTIPLVTATYDKSGNIKGWDAINNQYMDEASIYKLGMILRTLEMQFKAANPNIHFNIDDNPEIGLKFLLTASAKGMPEASKVLKDWMINSYRNELIDRYKAQSGKEISELDEAAQDNIRLRILTELQEYQYNELNDLIDNLKDILYINTNKNKLLLTSLYAFLFDKTKINGEAHFGLVLANFNGLYKNSSRLISYETEDVDKLFSRELLKVGLLAYLFLNSKFSFLDERNLFKPKTNYILSMLLDRHDAAPLLSGLKDFTQWMLTRSNIDDLMKLALTNEKNVTGNSDDSFIYTVFCRKVLNQLNIESGYFDSALKSISTNIYTIANSIYQKIKDIEEDTAYIDKLMKIEDIVREVNKDLEGQLLTIVPFYQANKITTFKSPVDRSSIPAFGLSTLIMKDALSIDNYVHKRGFEYTNNFFTENPIVFTDTENTIYPGSTIILDSIIDNNGDSIKFLNLSDQDSFLGHFIGGYMSGLSVKEHGRDGSILLTKLTTYADKSRAFLKCLNGNASINTFTPNTIYDNLYNVNSSVLSDFAQSTDSIILLDYYYRKRLLINELINLYEPYYLYAKSQGIDDIENLREIYNNKLAQWYKDNETILSNVNEHTKKVNFIIQFDTSAFIPALARYQKLLLTEGILEQLNDFCSKNNFANIEFLSYHDYKNILNPKLDPELHEWMQENKVEKFPITFNEGIGLNRVLIGDLLKLRNLDVFSNWVKESVASEVKKHKQTVQDWIEEAPLLAVELFKKLYNSEDSSYNYDVIDNYITNFVLYNNFIARQYLDLTIGLYYKDKPLNPECTTIEQERSSRLASSTKRAIGYTSTKEELQLNLLKGVSKEMKVAHIANYELPVAGTNGKLSNISVFNGATFISPYYSRMANVSYGFGNWGTKKTYGHSFFNGIPSSIMEKHAEFVLDNKYMRHTYSDVSAELLFKKTHNDSFSANGIKNNLLYNFQGINYFNEFLKEDPYYYWDSTNLTYKRVIKVEYEGDMKYKIYTADVDKNGSFKNDLAPLYSFTAEWDSIYDIFKSLHGIDCCSVVNDRMTFDESIHKLIMNMIINVGDTKGSTLTEIQEYTQDTINQPLRSSFIYSVSVEDAIKNGVTNKNPYERFDDKNGLYISTIRSNQIGKSLEAGHIIDDESYIKELTQAFNTISVMGYFTQDAYFMYYNIALMIKRASSNLQSKNVLDTIVNDYINSKNLEEPIVHFIQSLIENNFELDNFPDTPFIGMEIARSIISTYNKEVARREYQGNASVLKPTNGLIQLYRLGPSQSLKLEDILNYGISLVDKGIIDRNKFKQVIDNYQYVSRIYNKEFLSNETLDMNQHAKEALLILTMLYINNNNIFKDDIPLLEDANDFNFKDENGNINNYQYLLDHYDDPEYELFCHYGRQSGEISGKYTLLEIYDLVNLPEALDKAIIVNANGEIIKDDVLLENSDAEHNIRDVKIDADRIKIARISSLINDPELFIMRKMYLPTDLLGLRYKYTINHEGKLYAITDNTEVMGAARAVLDSLNGFSKDRLKALNEEFNKLTC